MEDWKHKPIKSPVNGCLDCIAKALKVMREEEHRWDSSIPLDNDKTCIHRSNQLKLKEWDRVECGRWHINPSYYEECRSDTEKIVAAADLPNKTRECAFDLTCARDCVRRFVNKQQAHSCGRASTAQRYCIDYGVIHYGGIHNFRCSDRCNEAELITFADHMKRNCAVTEPEVCLTTTTPAAADSLYKIIIPTASLTVLCVIILILAAFYYRRRIRQGRSGKQVFFTSPLAVSSYPSEIQNLIRKRGIPPSQLLLEERVGHGNFGVVRKAKLFMDEENTTSLVVAAKLLKSAVPCHEAIEAFLYEALYMSQLAHPNIVHLVGLVWQNGEPPALILPYMGKGDLLTLVQTQSVNFNTADLVNFGDQIVSGCKYLETQHVVHRDIALNNCLVSDLFVVKISDFGLSREDHYQVDVKERQLRWKWLAPECMSEGRFTSKSDVWAFGILLWEMFSDGGIPYPAMGSASVLEESLKTGYRMAKPEKMPDYIYEQVMVIWNSDPEQRPSFSKLDQEFKDIMVELEQDINYDYTPDTMESLFVHELEGSSGESHYSDRPPISYVRMESVPHEEREPESTNGFERQESYLQPNEMRNFH